MTRATRRLLILVVLLAAPACAGATSAGAAGSGGPRTRADLITLAEIEKRSGYSNLYDLIHDLRPRWLRAQGPDTLMGSQGQVQVHMDGNRLGGVEVLRRLATAGVTSIRWITPIDAGARYGLDHSHGAIVVSTRPVH